MPHRGFMSVFRVRRGTFRSLVVLCAFACWLDHVHARVLRGVLKRNRLGVVRNCCQFEGNGHGEDEITFKARRGPVKVGGSVILLDSRYLTLVLRVSCISACAPAGSGISRCAPRRSFAIDSARRIGELNRIF
ncbi:hypothetical protein C8R43DRAFT_1039849 [Mycena crocata]|nr:hypothetical protein C8R43DRAFT_1039849 [Mycena crocata]